MTDLASLPSARPTTPDTSAADSLLAVLLDELDARAARFEQLRADQEDPR